MSSSQPARPPPLIALSHFIHRRFLWLLFIAYVAAALGPGWGLWMRDVSIGEVAIMQERVPITLPLLMLMFILLNAGLGVQFSELKHFSRNLMTLSTGMLANLLMPIAFLLGISQVMQLWHNPDEAQSIIMGLGIIAAMPIAGSSTAWSQNANGSMVVSLGLVLPTTFLSPITMPLVLHLMGLLTIGDYSEDLHELASHGTGLFLILGVILPSIAGVMLHYLLGAHWISRVKPNLKIVNSAILLLLIYSNAAISLPKAIAHPDPDFLAVMLIIAFGLCGFAFVSGWLVAQLLRVDRIQRTSLMFGLGMRNNGTALVLVSTALADHPRMILLIVFYNLVQHVVAGSVSWKLSRQK